MFTGVNGLPQVLGSAWHGPLFFFLLDQQPLYFSLPLDKYNDNWFVQYVGYVWFVGYIYYHIKQQRKGVSPRPLKDRLRPPTNKVKTIWFKLTKKNQ